MEEIRENMDYFEKEGIKGIGFLLNPYKPLSEKGKVEFNVYEEALKESFNPYSLERILSDEDKKKITDLSPETINQLSTICELVYKAIKTEEHSENKYNVEFHSLRLLTYLMGFYLQAFAKMCSKQ